MFEYQIVERTNGMRLSSFTSILNRFGKQGWRVVDQSYRMNNGTGSVMMERKAVPEPSCYEDEDD